MTFIFRGYQPKAMYHTRATSKIVAASLAAGSKISRSIERIARFPARSRI